MSLPVPTKEVVCASCGTRNRVGAYGIDVIPQCAKCKTKLPESIAMRAGRFVARRFSSLLVVGGLGALIAFNPKPLADMWRRFNETASEQSVRTVGPPQAACIARPEPPSGRYARYDRAPLIAPLTIRTREGSNYFLKFEEAGTRRPIMTLYIRGGTKIEQNMPLGQFTLKYATGDIWCGDQDLFGPRTGLSEADKLFNFDEDHSYTVELIPQRGGNLPIRTINRQNF